MQTTRILLIGFLSAIICFAVNSSAIKCYHCHSFHNEACDDPFEEEANGNDDNGNSTDTAAASSTTLLVDCDSLDDGHNYTFCRKTTQTATRFGDMTRRIVRSCGFMEEDRLAPDEGEDAGALKCYRRTGTHAVEMIFCGCYEDGCNSASVNGISSVLLLLLGISAIVYHH